MERSQGDINKCIDKIRFFLYSGLKPNFSTKMITDFSDSNAIDTQLAKSLGSRLELHFVVDKTEAQKLIADGYDLNALTEHSNLTPFLMALRDSRDEVTKCLIVAGCDVTINGPGNNTPLHMAAMSHNVFTIALLLGLGFSKDGVTDRGETVLHTVLLLPHHAGPILSVLLRVGDNNAILDVKDKLGRTPLMVACESKQMNGVHGAYNPLGSIKALIAAGCNPNLRNNQGDTALHLLCRKPSEKESIATLLEYGADCTVVNNDGETLLYAACQSDSGINIEALVGFGCDPNVLDSLGSTILHQVQSYHVLQLLLNAPFIKPRLDIINGQDIDGNSPLHLYVPRYYNIEMIRAIIAAGADLTLTNKMGQTCLHVSCFSPNVQALVEGGSDTNAVDNLGKTVLHLITNLDELKVVLNAPKPPTTQTINAKDSEGNSPLLIYVKQYNNVNMIQAIIAAGVDLTITNNEGQSCLHRAYDSQTNVQLLIDAGCDTNVVDNNGRSVLHLVKHFETLNVILQAPTNPPTPQTINAKDNEGNSPLLTMASIGHNVDMIQTIIGAGADVTITNNEGQSCLHRAHSSITNILALIGAGCDPNVIDNCGRSVLHLVLNYEVLNEILRATNTPITPQTINAQDMNGNSCLHLYIIRKDACQLVTTAVGAGVDLNAINNDGQSCLHTLALHLQWFSLDTLKFMVEEGADIFCQDKDGKTPYDVMMNLQNVRMTPSDLRTIQEYLDEEMKRQRGDHHFKREKLGQEEGVEEEEEMEGDEEENLQVEGDVEEEKVVLEEEEEEDEGDHKDKKPRVSLATGSHGDGDGDGGYF